MAEVKVPQAHEPIRVTGAEGMIFVKCTCRDDRSPISRLWLTEHWQGSVDDGVAAIKAVVARQAEQAARPTTTHPTASAGLAGSEGDRRE